MRALELASADRGRVLGVLLPAIVPVVGVALFGWDTWTILIVYWAETWFVVIDGFIRVAIASGVPESSSSEAKTEASTGGCLLSGYVLLSGVQLFYTGAIVFTVVPRMLGRSDFAIADPLVLLAGVAVAGVAQLRDHRRFMEEQEYLDVTPVSQGRAPMKRLNVLWVTVFAASIIGFVLPGLASPMLVILAKAMADVMAEFEIGPFAEGQPEARPV